MILTDPERLNWLRLIRSENIGPINFDQLLAKFGSATAALEALPDLTRKRPIRGQISGLSSSSAYRRSTVSLSASSSSGPG